MTLCARGRALCVRVQLLAELTKGTSPDEMGHFQARLWQSARVVSFFASAGSDAAMTAFARKLYAALPKGRTITPPPAPTSDLPHGCD